MASTSEKGHAKNIANAALLINYATQLGATYNPSNGKIKVTNLQAVHDLSKAKHLEALDLVPPYTLAVNNREDLFAPLNKKVAAMHKVLKASADVLPNLIADYQTISRRITGARKKTINPNNEDATQYSTSKQSFDQRTNNFTQLINLLKNVPTYNPNEVDYQITTLESLRDSMLAATNAVNNTYVPLTNARAIRNDAMYLGNDHLINIFSTAKTYIQTIVPKNSTVYKAVVKLKFTKMV